MTQRNQSSEEEVAHLGEQDHYTTTDLGLAGALVCFGLPVVALDRTTHRNRVEFVFKREDGLDRLIEAYWSDRLDIKARSYFDALRALKSRLYSEQ